MQATLTCARLEEAAPTDGHHTGRRRRGTFHRAAPFVDGFGAFRVREHRVVSHVIRIMGLSAFAAVATPLIALGGAAIAIASPGAVDANPGIEDYDGTMGNIVGAVTGDQRAPVTQSTDGHQIVSDICYLRGKGCLLGDNYGSHTVSATTGIKDGPGSAMDADGIQADDVRGPDMVAKP